MIPDLDLARLRKWVDAQNANLPARVRGEIEHQIDVSDRAVTLFECRPPFQPQLGPEWSRSPVARFRYTKTRKEWTLYWMDRNLKFRKYDEVPPTPHIDHLIAEVDADPTCIFWG